MSILSIAEISFGGSQTYGKQRAMIKNKIRAGSYQGSKQGP